MRFTCIFVILGSRELASQRVNRNPDMSYKNDTGWIPASAGMTGE